MEGHRTPPRAGSEGGQELVLNVEVSSADESLKTGPSPCCNQQMPIAGEKRKMLASEATNGGKIQKKKKKKRDQHVQGTGGGKTYFEKSKGQPPILKNPMLIRLVVEKSGIKSTDVVLEIGPGTGNLRKKLLECAKSVVAVELDTGMAVELNRRFQGTPFASCLKVIEGDILQCDLPYFDVCVGNIPYSMSCPLIFKLNSHRSAFRSAAIIVPRDFARCLVANPGDPLYCCLSVNIQLLARVSYLSNLGRNNFRPVPEANLSLVHIEPRQPLPSVDFKEWDSFIRICFMRKNRTIGSIFKQKSILARLEKNYKTTQLSRLSGNPDEVGDGNHTISEELIGSIVDDKGMMEGEKENGDADGEEEIEADSSSNLPEDSGFKDIVMGILCQGDFQEKRPSKLTQVDFLYLLSLFNKADIHFS